MLVKTIRCLMLTDGLMRPPSAFVDWILAGVVEPDSSGHIDPYFKRLLRWLSFKQATGTRPAAVIFILQYRVGHKQLRTSSHSVARA